MINRRHISLLGVVGLVILFLTDGFGFESHNGVTSISLSPLVLVTWIFVFIAVFSTKISETNPTSIKAPWWCKTISFFYDFILFFILLFVPVTFLSLVIELGGLPPPWSITDIVSSKNNYLFLTSIISFILFWAVMGLALHPRIRTPGMMLCNIDLRVKDNTPTLLILLFGVFGYYGVFIPLFNVFALGISVNGNMFDE